MPTIAESGVPGFQFVAWCALLAPAKTPAAMLEKLSTELVAICKLPETQERFAGLGALASCGGTKELEKVVADDTQRWGRVIKQGNIKAE